MVLIYVIIYYLAFLTVNFDYDLNQKRYHFLFFYLWIPDMILNFFKMPKRNNSKITSKMVVKDYLKSTFVIDLIANVGYLLTYTHNNFIFLQYLRLVNIKRYYEGSMKTFYIVIGNSIEYSGLRVNSSMFSKTLD